MGEVTMGGAAGCATTGVVTGARRAVSIEGLLDWAYRVECVWELAGAFEGGGPAGGWDSSAAACLAIGALGGRVDGGPAMWAMPETVADDALAVHAAVISLGRARSGPVIQHARRGTRPALDGGPVVRLERIWKDSGAGRREHIEEYRQGYRGGKVAWLCRLRLVDRSGKIAESRERWREWREALALLAGHFRSQPQALGRWAVTESLPDAEPWAGCKSRGLDIAENP